MGEGFTLFSLHLYLHTLPLRAIASDPRRSMYEKRIKHKVATQAVKAKVKERGGEAFTSNQLYHNKFRRIGEEVKVKTQNSWMRARTRTREDGEMYMSLKKRTCIL